MTSKDSLFRAERYRKAEFILAQSLLDCKDEPSPQELQLRTLRQAMHMLVQLATETNQQVNELVSVISEHTRVADLDCVSYQTLLSQRWKLQREQDSISHKMKVVQRTITSLAFVSSGGGGSDAKEVQMSHPEDRAYTNLVSFLRYPQRVVPLHRRSYSRLFEFRPRPFHLDTSTAIPSIIMPSSQLTTTNTGSDTSLDLLVQTPVVTDSLNKQQTHFVISDEEAGTATILTQILPNLTPPDPSDVKIKLPDYVHELLANFDVHHHDLTPSGATLRFKPNETQKIKARKYRFWSFRRASKDQVPRSATSQPVLPSQSSFRRLSQLMLILETSTPRKANTKREEPKKSVSGNSRDKNHNSVHSPPSSNKAIGGIASKIARRISFVPSEHTWTS